MSNVNTLKAQLREALEQDKYGQVLNLSSELARQDMDHVRFSIDASHLNRIGRELVTKQETAVAELVKNGYDADATRVTLLFQDSNRVGGTLVIADNGLGMTRQQLIDGFMRLSTSDKAERPLSEKYKRRRAGRKGIGRFSAQRLGRQLILKTQTENSDHALQLSINWDAFEANSELTTISSRVEVIDKENRQGTTLSIKNLRDIWSEAQIRRSYRYISELLQPFPISKKKQNDDSDPGFESVFYLQLADNRQLIADKKSAVFQYALAEIEGHVDDKGRAFWSMQSQRYNIDEKNQQVRLGEKTSDERFKFLNDVYFKAYYYLNVYDLLPRNERARIVNMLNEQGGIRLYRNGFRVLPYGEPYNNWLGLDSPHLNRTLPPHRNSNFLGFAELIDLHEKYFNETSSREGLIENEAFCELRQFIRTALLAAMFRMGEARNLKMHPAHRKNREKNPAKEAQQIVKELEQITHIQHDGSKTDKADARETTEEIKSRIMQLGESGQAMLEENGMLRVLASLGLIIGEFTHEIRQSLAAMVANVILLSSQVSEAKKAVDTIKQLDANLESLQSYARYFDDAIMDNAHRQLQVQELRDIINAFENVIEPVLHRKDIKFDKQIQGYDLFARPMHQSEWSSVLFNLFSNSLKAIHRKKADGKLFIRAGEEEDHLFLDFADNGDGIPPEHEDRIFHAFFTTSMPCSPFAPDSEQLTGAGLGLKIVKDIITSARGDIFLITPPEGYTTCFHIEIPKATKEEIPDDAY